MQLHTHSLIGMCIICKGVVRTFPGGPVAHLENQNEGRGIQGKFRKYMKMRKNLGNIVILPTWDYESGYAPSYAPVCMAWGRGRSNFSGGMGV